VNTKRDKGIEIGKRREAIENKEAIDRGNRQ